MAHERSIVRTDRAPAAVGPYSQAVRSGDLLFTAGQIALPPEGGALVSEDVAEQARQVLGNLSAILAEAGGDLSDVLKTTIFLVDMADFARVNEVYAEAFGERPPARSTIAVAALPLGAKVKIEAIARLA